MTIKLSDFILEQSISDANVYDIIIEQAAAELDVCMKLAEAYSKQMALEYFSEDKEEEDIFAPETFQEAEAATADEVPETTSDPEYESVKESGKKVGQAVATGAKDIGSKVAGFFKAIFGAVIGFFKGFGGKLLKLEDEVVKTSKQVKANVITWSDAQAEQVYEFLKNKYGEDGARRLALYNPTNTKAYLANLSTALDELSTGVARWVSQVENYHGLPIKIGSTVGRNLDLEGHPEFEAAMNEFNSMFATFNEKLKKITLSFSKDNASNVEVLTGAEFKAQLPGFIDYFASKEARSYVRSLSDKSNKIADDFNTWQRKKGLHHESFKASSSNRTSEKNSNYNRARELLSKVQGVVSDINVELKYIAGLYMNLKKCADNIAKGKPGASAESGVQVES